ncbi:hypothetical protein CBL_10952 [Carabus blaptoides fortunei]
MSRIKQKAYRGWLLLHSVYRECDPITARADQRRNILSAWGSREITKELQASSRDVFRGNASVTAPLALARCVRAAAVASDTFYCMEAVSVLTSYSELWTNTPALAAWLTLTTNVANCSWSQSPCTFQVNGPEPTWHGLSNHSATLHRAMCVRGRHYPAARTPSLPGPNKSKLIELKFLIPIMDADDDGETVRANF